MAPSQNVGKVKAKKVLTPPGSLIPLALGGCIENPTHSAIPSQADLRHHVSVHKQVHERLKLLAVNTALAKEKNKISGGGGGGIDQIKWPHEFILMGTSKKGSYTTSLLCTMDDWLLSDHGRSKE